MQLVMLTVSKGVIAHTRAFDAQGNELEQVAVNMTLPETTSVPDFSLLYGSPAFAEIKRLREVLELERMV